MKPWHLHPHHRRCRWTQYHWHPPYCETCDTVFWHDDIGHKPWCEFAPRRSFFFTAEWEELPDISLDSRNWSLDL